MKSKLEDMLKKHEGIRKDESPMFDVVVYFAASVLGLTSLGGTLGGFSGALVGSAAGVIAGIFLNRRIKRAFSSD